MKLQKYNSADNVLFFFFKKTFYVKYKICTI